MVQVSTPFLSIIIPAHNEETRLPPSLTEIDSYLRQQPYDAEVIIVENGSVDRTHEVALKFASTLEYVRVIQSPDNLRGKGLAVKQACCKRAANGGLSVTPIFPCALMISRNSCHRRRTAMTY